MTVSTQTSSHKQVENENIQQSEGWMKERCKNLWSIHTLHCHLPITEWLPKYTAQEALADLVAGITIGLTVIPQSMAYAIVAGMPIQYGLYSSFIGCFVYVFFGNFKEAAIGTSAITALLTMELSSLGGPGYSILLSFICGCVEICCAFLCLGFIIDFVSAPVISGFSSAAAIIITATQLRGLTGLKFKANDLIPVLRNIFLKIKEINYWDLILGLISITILLILRKLGLIQWQDSEDRPPSKLKKILRTFLWFISIARNAVVVLIASAVSYYFVTENSNKFTLTTEVPAGLPPFQLPEFEVEYENVTHTFPEIMSDFGANLFLLPLLSIVEHVAIARVIATERHLNTNQEFFAIGISNLLNSFVSGFPGTGSFSRSALNSASGAKTPLGGIYTGTIVLLSLKFLTSLFRYIPTAALSSVIITAVIFMIEFHMLAHLWKTNKLDLMVMISTFLACIFLNAKYGILIGIAISFLVLLYNSARPHVKVTSQKSQDLSYIKVRPDRMLSFPSVEHVRFKLKKAAKLSNGAPLIFDGTYLSLLDYTIGKCIITLVHDMRKKKQTIVFAQLQESVLQSLKVLDDDIQCYSTIEEAETALHEKSLRVASIVSLGLDDSMTSLSVTKSDADSGILLIPYGNSQSNSGSQNSLHHRLSIVESSCRL